MVCVYGNDERALRVTGGQTVDNVRLHDHMRARQCRRLLTCRCRFSDGMMKRGNSLFVPSFL
jgi:hypothetical protein